MIGKQIVLMNKPCATPYLIGVVAVPVGELVQYEFYPSMSNKVEELTNGEFGARIAELASAGTPATNNFPRYLGCVAPGIGKPFEYIVSESRAITGMLREKVWAHMREYLKAPGASEEDEASPVGDVFSTPGKIEDLPSGAFWRIYSENVADAV